MGKISLRWGGVRVLNTNKKIEDLLKKLSLDMEKMKLAEYIELLNNPKRLLWVNFIAGVARGLGTAIGFTILFAIILYFLQKLVLLKLPLISDFIADIVRMVQNNTRIPKY
ncbi:MAG: membrane protein [Peptococcaceae bacterium BICA1-8]|nr:MAG: membrane protein [Peptococcaceae bacterium BICA1-8]